MFILCKKKKKKVQKNKWFQKRFKDSLTWEWFQESGLEKKSHSLLLIRVVLPWEFCFTDLKLSIHTNKATKQNGRERMKQKKKKARLTL